MIHTKICMIHTKICMIHSTHSFHSTNKFYKYQLFILGGIYPKSKKKEKQ